MHVLCIFLYLVGVIQAIPTTNATNTTTDNSLEAPSFTTRTLWAIVSSSILTLFACIYSAIHPNIPNPKDGALHILQRRLGIMIMALIAPELIITWAMRQWLSACKVTRQFKDSGYPSICPEQSEEKAPDDTSKNRFLRFIRQSPFFVLLCFFTSPFFRQVFSLFTKSVLSALVSLWRVPYTLVRCIEAEQSESSDLEDYTWTQTHSFFVLMGGFMLYVDEKPYHTLQPDEVLKLIRTGCIDTPTLTANQIHDRSKGNAISKGLIMIQVAWFVVQLITRAIYHLETTQLEMGTLAFAVLNFASCAVWWSKPLNVRCPHPVHWKSIESRPEDHIDFTERDELAPLGISVASVFHPILELIGWLPIPTCRKLRVPTFGGSLKLEGLDIMALQCAALLMANIFGGVHCMAWFFAFPTHQEQLLWRISAVAMTCTPWICVNIYSQTIGVRNNRVLWVVYRVVSVLTYSILAVVYVSTRAILLVLMFTTLRDLPPDAYKVISWTSLVPHL
ncbi:hypothetical protein BDR04DRAFT_1160194 [Suillus decipiens]|nr:hypothetical protein BDR04DRAFT_1160194 [Suillus decipiens]